MNIIMLTIDDPDDDSEHIINHRLVSWFNKYNQHNEYKNNIEKKKKKPCQRVTTQIWRPLRW